MFPPCLNNMKDSGTKTFQVLYYFLNNKIVLINFYYWVIVILDNNIFLYHINCDECTFFLKSKELFEILHLIQCDCGGSLWQK